jgi:MATE family multidrug resistance protein
MISEPCRRTASYLWFPLTRIRPRPLRPAATVRTIAPITTSDGVRSASSNPVPPGKEEPIDFSSGMRRLALHRDDTRRVLQLAYPIVLGSLSVTLLSVVDTAMLGRLGPAPLASSGVAGVLFFAVAFPLSAIGVGVQTLTARRFGEGNAEQCGRVTNAGVVLALLLGIPMTIAAPWLARSVGPVLSDDPQVVALGTVYLHYRLFGAGFMFINWVFRGFFAGIGETRHQMIASVLITATNVLFDFFLIFGHAGFPRMGIQGAGIASSIALFVGTLYFLSAVLSPRYRRRFACLQHPVLSRRWTVPIVRLSLPVVVQRLIGHGSWFVFFTVVARIGTVELAATNVIRSIYHLSFMLAAGLGTAAAALVGQNLGAHRPERAERLAWEATKLASYAMAAVGLLFIVIPDWVFRIYTADPTVMAAGRSPLAFLGVVQAFAAVGIVLAQSLQGAGNTRFVMATELVVCASLYLPLVYVLGLRTPLGLIGAWTGEYFYWAARAAIMTWKFRRGTWKRIIV